MFDLVTLIKSVSYLIFDLFTCCFICISKNCCDFHVVIGHMWSLIILSDLEFYFFFADGSWWSSYRGQLNSN